jgi:hypothetical protein
MALAEIKDMWKLSELDDNDTYFLRLCERADGYRYLALVSASRKNQHSPQGLETEEVPHDVLRGRDLDEIARSVKLKNGGRFVFDAHGLWFTEEEAKAFAEARWDPNKVKWINGRVPRFAPI